jgi:ABC-type multidrug transport system ATPase subunit
VQEICDCVGILHQGKLIREGRLDDLISSRTRRRSSWKTRHRS